MHYELEEAARGMLSVIAGDENVAWPNVPFTPPKDGQAYFKFDYMPAVSEPVGLSRKCRYYVGIVQIGVIFRPDSGTDYPRQAAKIICEKFPEGLEVGPGYVYTAGEVHNTVKTETGWVIPVRFKVRAEEHIK